MPKAVRSVLGMINYLKRFIHDYSSLTHLDNLPHKETILHGRENAKTPSVH